MGSPGSEFSGFWTVGCGQPLPHDVYWRKGLLWGLDRKLVGAFRKLNEESSVAGELPVGEIFICTSHSDRSSWWLEAGTDGVRCKPYTAIRVGAPRCQSEAIEGRARKSAE